MSTHPQDVYKDAGECVLFVYLRFNRQDQAAELDAFRDFADTSQAINRSMNIRAQGDDLRVSIGVSRNGWDYLFPGAARPQELEEFKGLVNAETPSIAMPEGIGADADLFLHIRAKREAVVYEVAEQYRLSFKDFARVVDETHGFRYLEGRAIIGFIDGTENPTGIDAPMWAEVGSEDPQFTGGSYAFAQKWIHDMDAWRSLGTHEQERAIGREQFTDLELDDEAKAPNAHNVTSKFIIDGEENKIIRMNVPFSDPASGITGTYFIGYSGRWSVTKGMLTNMVSKKDYLLTFSKVLFGQVFFVPSLDLLGDIADGAFPADEAK